jgi:hypothetical protein
MTKVWGPMGWMTLHSISVCYPDNPTHEEKLICMRTIELFGQTITCRYCKEHFQKMYESYKSLYPTYLNSRKDLFVFATRIHNSVNKRLDKPVIQSVKDALELLQNNTKSVSGRAFREQYINYLIRNWAYEMTGEAMMLKHLAYELQKINNSYWNTKEQDFNIEIEEDDIKILIPDNIRYTPTTMYSFNIENLAKATNVGFKGGRLKLR